MTDRTDEIVDADVAELVKRLRYAPTLTLPDMGERTVVVAAMIRQLLVDRAKAADMIDQLARRSPQTTNDFAWLIEAPGQKYLAARQYTIGREFHWTGDHNQALRFYSSEQADATMMAVRELAPDLFGFAVTLGDARATEHVWLPAHPTRPTT